MHVIISPEQFFQKWKTVCENRRIELLKNWEQPANYTSLILGNTDDVITQVARELQLEIYGDYYSLDAVLFTKTDLVGCKPPGQTWIQNIRVAFEHENFFTSGLFQETSHLLITRAGLRVLVAYPEGNKSQQVQTELDRLSKIIAESGLSDPAFLFITGKRTSNKQDIVWLGYTYDNGQLFLSHQ